MNIQKSTILGFCAGVKNAVDIAEGLRKKHPDRNIYTLGYLLHNAPEVDRLTQLGIVPVNIKSHNFEKGDIAIISAHGISPSETERLTSVGVEVVNATCETVKRVQRAVEMMRERGMYIIIVGSPVHAEVLGHIGYAGDNFVVVDPYNMPKILPKTERLVGIISQTTITKEAFNKVLVFANEQYDMVEEHATICGATYARQEAGKNVAKQADITLVIGGKKSANTRALAKECEKVCKKVYCIENEDDLAYIACDIDENANIAIVSGASTPIWLIDFFSSVLSVNRLSF